MFRRAGCGPWLGRACVHKVGGRARLPRIVSLLLACTRLPAMLTSRPPPLHAGRLQRRQILYVPFPRCTDAEDPTRSVPHGPSAASSTALGPRFRRSARAAVSDTAGRPALAYASLAGTTCTFAAGAGPGGFDLGLWRALPCRRGRAGRRPVCRLRAPGKLGVNRSINNK